MRSHCHPHRELYRGIARGADGNVIAFDPMHIEEFLHGDADRRAAAPDADQMCGPETALQHSARQPETVAQQLIGGQPDFLESLAARR